MTADVGTGGRCYEDFEVGLVMRHPLGRTVTATDNAWFALMTVSTELVSVSKDAVSPAMFEVPPDFKKK